MQDNQSFSLVAHSDAKSEAAIGKLYREYFGDECMSIVPIGASGSNRRYYRVCGSSGCAVVCWGPDPKENQAFVALAKGLADKGINVPEVYGVSADWHYILQKDLGDTDLLAVIHSAEGDRVIRDCMKDLARIQTQGRKLIREGAVWQHAFDARHIMFDLNYFKYEFLRPLEVVYDEDALQNDFEKLARRIGGIGSKYVGLMYRDFQSRNVMVMNGRPWYIDFQGARSGPVLYDVVSFLWQGRAGFTEEERKEYLNLYINEYAKTRRNVNKEMMMESFGDVLLVRTLQVLGAYGLRGIVQGRAKFIESIPQALNTLGDLLDKGKLIEYPELGRIVRNIVSDNRFVLESREKLTVEVISFSFKQGYPRNMTGHGGGFVFDCRAIHNPGRYEEYKQLTGTDAPVRNFLEARGEVQRFLADAWSLTDKAVATYLERGFTSLQVCFGCTGGRHRSVYCADKTARHIKEEWGDQLELRLKHREQGTDTVI